MTESNRIGDALARAGGAVCDDCVAVLAGWKRRQSARAAGLRLVEQGEAQRLRSVCVRCGKVKTVTRAAAGAPAASVAEAIVQAPSLGAASLRPEDRVATLPSQKPWYWEGNVQAALAAYLVQRGYRLRQLADTATHETGIDLIAEKDGRELWVTVKGYPQGTPKTAPSTQSRHWFSHALFDVVLYRSRNDQVDIAVALPDGFVTYLNLAARVGWLREHVPFTLLWIGEDGQVRRE
jgi:hypothetical protein